MLTSMVRIHIIFGSRGGYDVDGSNDDDAGDNANGDDDDDADGGDDGSGEAMVTMTMMLQR